MHEQHRLNEARRDALADFDDEDIRFMAAHHGVCVRPIVRQLVDTVTGQESLVPIPCGSTRQNVCGPCADKARRVRMQQCREGWHRTEEFPGVRVPNLIGLSLDGAYSKAAEVVTLAPPYTGPLSASLGVSVTEQPSEQPPGTVVRQTPAAGRHLPPGASVRVVVSTGSNATDTEPKEDDTGSVARRSTRRREDAPPLPKVSMDERRTCGRVLRSPNGKTYRPSMFVTLTLPSYGKVLGDGTPRDPGSYDYRRAALDAMHFPGIVDRFWQNLRRCAGYNVQYFSTVEAQHRLALHLHAAIRGTVPDSILRQIAAATYHQVWWPPVDRPVYVGRNLPVWSDAHGGYVDPSTNTPLDTWARAYARTLRPGAEPAHVVWLGSQVDRQWFLPGRKRSDRRIGYLTKYLTKSIAETYDPDLASKRQKRHRDRLAKETRWLPCSPECANWLRFGVQPKKAEPDMVPGECDRPAHDPDNLGHGGRRVLVSSQWSGKTIDQHKVDRARIVKEALAESGVEMPERDRCSATATRADGTPRYRWEAVDINPATAPEQYRQLVERSIREQVRWRREYDDAKLAAAIHAERTHRAARAHPPGTGPTSHLDFAADAA